MAVVLLEDILELPVLRLATVRTASAACRRPVSWASVIEMPVDDFVRPDELVLTTGMGCGESGGRFMDFVGQVIAANAAAIAVSTGPYLEKLPPETLELAERESFPLIELPWEVRFADITRAVSEALLTEEHRLLIRAQDLQTTMLERVVAGAGGADIAQILAEELGLQVRLADPAGRILGSSKGPTGRPRPAPEPACTPLRVPVRSARQTEGFILVGGAAGSAPDLGRNTQVLEHASAACAFWFLHQRALREAQARRQDDFVWNLAKGQIAEEEATAQGSVLGYRLDRSRVCVLGRLLPDPRAEGVEHRAFADEDAEQRRVEHVVLQVARDRGHAVMSTRQQATFVLYVETDGRNLAPVHRLLDEVGLVLDRAGIGGHVSWGLAPAGQDVGGFALGYAAAKEALEIGYRQCGAGHRTSSEDLQLHRVLSRVAEDPAAARLVADTLGPLIDYDRRKHGQLVQTLGELIRARGQASKAAQALVLHRQSLLYRLAKIESLTGHSLADPDNWFQLSLAHRLLLLDPDEKRRRLTGPPSEREDDDDG